MKFNACLEVLPKTIGGYYGKEKIFDGNIGDSVSIRLGSDGV
jgi:hypothetical protein